MKKLPQGLWKDTGLDDHPFRVIYYDSRSRCYRIEYQSMMGMRVWAGVEEFGPGKRYQSMGALGLLVEMTQRARVARYDRTVKTFELETSDFSL